MDWQRSTGKERMGGQRRIGKEGKGGQWRKGKKSLVVEVEIEAH